jgi:hypothetical protein
VRLGAHHTKSTSPPAEKVLLPNVHPNELQVSSSGEVFLKQSPLAASPVTTQSLAGLPFDVQPSDVVVLPDGTTAVKQYRGDATR